MSLPPVQRTSEDASSSLDSSRISQKCRRAWAVDNSCGMSCPSFVRQLWARNATIETDWHVVKPGHCARLVDREGAVFFRVCWIFSTPLILAPQHSIIFVGLSPGFHPSVAVLTSASSILAFKWSKGLASNSLHAKFATT